MDAKIAIIGMAGRFPDAVNTGEFYKNLQQARYSIGRISQERIAKTTLSPDVEYQVRGYMNNIDLFDFKFFNITPGEAQHMDPHQRLLLEVVFETMEDAGYNLDRLDGSDTAVYVADKNLRYYEHADKFDPTLVTGNSGEFLAARISRTFNLNGAVAVVDTSCSSSLVALHNACNELLLGNAEHALVCGASLELFPYKKAGQHIEVDSPDGTSIPLSDKANGMVYGEAVIGILLKPLDKAIADNDHIHAVITATAVNNNGNRAGSLTAPDSMAQAEVLKKAWSKARIHPADLGFIEAHGSGTQLGDSLEIAGMNMAFRSFTNEKQICAISTVKANIGHCRTVAGLAGLVKAVLSIEKKEILPAIYTGKPNPFVDLNNSSVYINETLKSWNPIAGKKRYGAVSAIGFSGTNCHVVLEEYIKEGEKIATDHGALILLSSWYDGGVKEYASQLLQHLKDHPSIELNDVAYTLGAGRKAYGYRESIVVNNRNELLQRLQAYVSTQHLPKVIAPATCKLNFIFSDNDNFSIATAEKFAKESPLFNHYYQHYLSLIPSSFGINNKSLQLFICQLSWHQILEKAGIRSKHLIGNGIGRITTRVVSNTLSFEDALADVLNYRQEAQPDLHTKLENLVRKEAQAGMSVFLDVSIGTAGNVALRLQQITGSGEAFHVCTPAPQPGFASMIHIGQSLFQAGFNLPEDFFVQHGGQRVALPARPFRKTRCWIREEAKPATQPAGNQAAATPGIAYDTFTRTVSAIWSDVIKNASIAADTHFFDVGGDSLKATQVINKLKKQFAIQLDFEDLFDYPVFEDFCKFINSQLSAFERLKLIWMDVLKIPDIAANDNFFELGGHSLLANQILNRLRAQTGIQLNFEDFFLCPTISSMAELMENRVHVKSQQQEQLIPLADQQVTYPVSHAQKRLWMISQLPDATVAYNECNGFVLKGEVAPEQLKQAVRLLIERHESLRTVFTVIAAMPHQQIKPWSGAYDMQYEDRHTEQDAVEHVSRFAEHLVLQPFDLEQGPLIKTYLFRISANEYVFLYNVHHIIFDEWSNSVLLKDLGAIYSSLCNGKTPDLKPLRIHYKDYSAWQEGQSMAASESYWLNWLKDQTPALELPYDFSRPPVKTYNGNNYRQSFPEGYKQQVDQVIREKGISSFMFMLAAVKAFFFRYSSQQTLVVGTPVAGRTDIDLEGQIGFYANTLILKTVISTADTFNTLLSQIKHRVIDAYEHQLYPFDLLIEKLGIKAERSRLPLFDIMVAYNKQGGDVKDALAMNGVMAEGLSRGRSTSKFDLSFTFIEFENKLTLSINYNTDLLMPGTIERWANHFFHLFGRLLHEPDQLLTRYTLAAEEELNEILHYGKGSKPAAALTDLVSAIENVSIQHAGALAIKTSAGNLSYKVYMELVNQVAAYLLSVTGIQRGQAVGVYMSRSPEMLVAITAILKAGGVYVPVSVLEPTSRTIQLLKQANVQIVIAGNDHDSLIANEDKRFSTLNITQLLAGGSGIALADWPVLSSSDVACVLFTSGSTGGSLPVRVEHGGLLNVATWLVNEFGLVAGEDVIMQRFSQVFDVALLEIFGALCNGAAVYLPADEELSDYHQLPAVIKKYGVTGIGFTPTDLQQFVDAWPVADMDGSRTTLKWVLSAGEVLRPELVHRYYNKLTLPLVNGYGPAEATILSTAGRVGAADTMITLGKPLPGVDIFILDNEMMPVPLGVPGEIYIGGIGLTDGYVQAPEKNALKYVYHNDIRVFKTGDIGKWLPGGDIYFIGRKDAQMKLNGFRIEPAEIENVILQQSSVSEAVVTVHQEGNAPAELIAYIVRHLPEQMPIAPLDQASGSEEAITATITALDIERLAAFNNSAVPIDLSKKVFDYLSHWATTIPQDIAVSDGDVSLNYQQLSVQVNVLATALMELKVNREEVIPVYCRRSADMLIAMLAIMKVGGIYLPLSTDYPQDRILNLVSDCGARFIISNQSAIQDSSQVLNYVLQHWKLESIIDLTTIQNNYKLHPFLLTGIIFPEIDDAQLAYIIYTSGSTGKPKGAMVEHRGMLNHIFAKIDLLGLGSHCKVIQNAPAAFDISIWQFLTAIVAGGQTIVYNDNVVHRLQQFIDCLETDQPHIFELVPSYLSALLDLVEKGQATIHFSCKAVMVTGEALKPSLVKRWFASFPSIQLINAYGPTEASDDITHYVMSGYDATVVNVPVGKAIQNMKIYIVDEDMNLCPIGAKGEICVAGIGVGRGYWNDPQKTAAVFMDSPWDPGVRLYKTGDIGRYLEDGHVEFLGRKDQQVKINGHRIETNEVEYALLSSAMIADAAVIPFKNREEETILVAYLIKNDERLDEEQVKAYLRQQLPVYMIPAHVVFMKVFPLSATGKIDRKAFPDPDKLYDQKAFELAVRAALTKQLPDYMIPRRIFLMDEMPRTASGKTDRKALKPLEVYLGMVDNFKAPSNDVQQALCNIWEQLLTHRPIGVIHNFFEIGGHSLKGMKLIAAIERQFGRSFSLRELFTNTTIEQQAILLSEKQDSAKHIISKAADSAYYPLTHAQRRLWILQQLDNVGSAYNITGGLQVNGYFSQETWDECWQLLIHRYEILRTTFAFTDGIPVQLVNESATGSLLQHIDATGYTDARPIINEWYSKVAKQQYDLQHGPLIQGVIIRTAESSATLIFGLHHIIADEWSLEIMAKKILSFYADKVNGGKSTIPAISLQYRDYAVWQHAVGEVDEGGARTFWHQQFEGEIPVLKLETDYVRPMVKSFNGDTVSLVLNDTGEALSRFSEERGTTIFVNLLAVLNVLLYRYSGQQDLVIGTPVAGRGRPELEDQVGLFQNTLALRTQLEGNDSFNTFVLQVKQLVLSALENQHYPFDKLVEELDLRRDLSRSPLFDVMMVLHHDAGDAGTVLQHEGLQVNSFSRTAMSSKFDLTFHFRKMGRDLSIALNYNSDLFSRQRVEVILSHFAELLNSVLVDPQLPLIHLNYIPAREKQLLLKDFQGNFPEVDDTIVGVFENRVITAANKLAVADDQCSLTYDELNRKVNQLTRLLLGEYGVRKGTVVAISIDRSTAFVTAALAVLKAGGIYLPLDSSFPADRISYMLENSAAALVISVGALDTTFPVIYWNTELSAVLSALEDSNPALPIDPSDGGYIIYTSGSTGRPKGVQVTHRNLVNYVAGLTAAYNISEDWSALLVSAVAYDLGYTTLWSSLLTGGTLYILPHTDFWSPIATLQLLQERQVNYIKLTPSHFHLLLQEARHYGIPADLRLILLGGEAIRTSDLQGWLELSPGTKLANHYGPTETTIGVITQGIVQAAPSGNELMLDVFSQAPVLGHPIGNHKIYVLDETGKLCGCGVPGELYIGGPGVSDGYINQPVLTAEKFIVNTVHPEGKLYRTGDRGLWTISGRIRFLGRSDEQLQIHGYRVEPGELAHCVLQYEGIREAVALVHTAGDDVQLVVYIVAAEGVSPDESLLRDYLLQRLPVYMMPSHIVQLDVLPLNANGKVDRHRLPVPVAQTAISTGSTAVSGNYEQLLAAAFEQVLGRNSIGREANFFQLGGDSIKAIQIASRLYREGYKIEIRDVFRFPVLFTMAEHIVALRKKADQSTVTGPIALTPIQWNFFRQELLYPHHYNQSVLLHINEPINAVLLTALLAKLQLHHDALRIVFHNEQQFNNGEEHPVYVSETDLRGNTAAEVTLHQSLQALQRSFDLTTGPLFKASLFHMDDGSRLLLVAHHLVVDGISWRIILEDLGELYRQWNNGTSLQLPLKTDSFQQWSSSLIKYRQSEQFASSIAYWQEKGAEQVPLLVQGEIGGNKGMRSFMLDTDNTTGLLTTAHTRYATEVNDLLLCALDRSLNIAFEKEKVWVMLEGHGREDTGAGIDVVRTVGWFTSVYPVLLSVGGQSDAGTAIKATKDMLRNIPDHGLGYGLLKQEGDSSVNSITPQVIFNYLGQFDADIRNSGFTIAKEGTGDSSAPEESLQYPVMISCIVLEGQLRVQIKYDKNYLSDELAVTFYRQFEQALKELIRHCLDPVDTVTPVHEFGYKGLSVEALDNIFD